MNKLNPTDQANPPSADASFPRDQTVEAFLSLFSLSPEQIVQWHEFFNGTLGTRVPVCVVHSCCGPCSLYPLKSLTRSSTLICYYFNPNIHPIAEYRHRQQTQQRALEALNSDPESFLVGLKSGPYHPAEFFKVAKNFKEEPEGGQRCTVCFRLRLEQTAWVAQALGANYFLSVMSVSRHKSSQQIASVLSEIFLSRRGIRPLVIDFKKMGGTQQSRAMSDRLKLYHQPYCGCIYSQRPLAPQKSV